MADERALSGVRVVELATFVAAPCCTRFLADQGADVIKIETLIGDGTRHAPLSEGRPVLGEDENVTFELENAGKRGIAMNLKDPLCFKALTALIAKADVFVTNWRPQALARMGLDYESLKARFPALVYGSVTGYGDEGPDKDLPGYDFTAFFARSGILGSLYERGTVPMNLIPSMGDRQVGMCLAAGVAAALYRAAKTGRGEKVSVSLLGTAVFTQGTMIQTAQYGLVKYPIVKRENPNPLTCAYECADGRFIQLSVPVFAMFPKVAAAFGRGDWLENPQYASQEALAAGGAPELYGELKAVFLSKTSEELSAILRLADLPFAVAQVWSEVLKDPQAWADGCFAETEFESGKRVLVRNPVHFADAGEPELRRAPALGQHTDEILREAGLSDGDIAGLRSARSVR